MDDLDRTVLDGVDRRLDPLVPTTPAPVTDLVRRGRARRARRRGLQAGLAAAVVVVATATTTAVVQGRDAAPGPTDPAASTPPPAADPSTRTVGLRDVVVDIPADWVATEQCSGSEVAFGPPGATCFSGVSVQLADRRADGFRGGVELRQNGLDVRRYDHVCGPAEDCRYVAWSTVTVDDAIAVTVVTPEGDALRDRIADTVRPLPDGSVVVPDVVGLDVGEAATALGDVGLDLPDTEPDFVVATTVPEAGSVVPVGSTIALAPIAVREDPGVPQGFRRVEYRGVAVAVPEDWVSCDEVGGSGVGLTFGSPDADGDCDTPAYHPERLSVTLARGEDVDDEVPTTSVNGLRVQSRIAAVCSKAFPCYDFDGTVLAVDQRVLVRLASPTEAVVKTVVGSVRAAE